MNCCAKDVETWCKACLLNWMLMTEKGNLGIISGLNCLFLRLVWKK